VDRTVSPSYVVDVADATRRLVESGSAFGLYHCVNAGACSWHDIATEIGRLLDRTAVLKPVTLESVALRARRPRYSALDCPRLRAAGIDMPAWQDALRRCLRQEAASSQ
jgi:dTDP-4-dehydrorhamnose reductase